LIKLEVLDRFALPNGDGEMVLAKRGSEFVIRVRGVELMNSRNHISEDELGRFAARLVAGKPGARVLIGGLGLGFTLRAVLNACPTSVLIDVVEIFPTVVRWNRGELAELAKRPLDDPRVTVIEADVAEVIERSQGTYDAIVLDVDNGPDPVFDANAKLYKRQGLAEARRALAPGGGLCVWSAFESPTFTRWLREVGFAAEMHLVRAYGARHYIWLAR
jgi:spermidine synthase